MAVAWAVQSQSSQAMERLLDGLAEEHGLSVYDAVYLGLAIWKHLPLASRDSNLNKAAKLHAIETLL